MAEATPAAGTAPAEPLAVTPPRRPGSVRRTTHIDMIFPPGGGLLLIGTARDLATPAAVAAPEPHDGDGILPGRVVAAASIEAHLDGTHTLTALTTSPADERAGALVGRTARKGFRAAVEEALGGEAASCLHQLLDDIPVAALISGYALLYRGVTGIRDPAEAHIRVNLCAGWQEGGVMLTALATTGTIPVPLGPATTDLVPPDDPLAWHEVGPLPPGAMRRRRLVEVAPGDPCPVWAMFRDTHVDPAGTETVLHEYSLTAALDAATMTLVDCRATPQVLPWQECPQAAASATRLTGRRVEELRDLVSREFKGTSTCTHLNDLLRSLAGLAALVPHLAPSGAAQERPSGSPLRDAAQPRGRRA